MQFWEELLLLFKNTSFLSIQIYSKYKDKISGDNTIGLFINELRLQLFAYHSSPEYDLLKIPKSSTKKVIFIKDNLKSNKHRNLIHPGYFNVNISLFTESQNHHAYFNRKVSIDERGEIKNCNSLSKSFGNINHESLEEIVSSTEFQQLWFIQKDKTLICRNCEFRYMCVDPREPLLNNDALYYHKVPCNYDPFSSTWTDNK